MAGEAGKGASGQDRLAVEDRRTSRSFEWAIDDGTVRAMDLRAVKVEDDDFGLMTYDPGFTNTACCRSSITFIDGDKGILRYRGYPIEQLAEKSTYLETAWLLIHGELPTGDQLESWRAEVGSHTLIHENIRNLIKAFRYDAHPMGMMVSTVAALSTFYPEANNVDDEEVRRRQIVRLIGKMPTLAAFSYRHSLGQRHTYPDDRFSFVGNFLSMLFNLGQQGWKPEPALERALDVLFILHADHEQNCSTNAMRSVGSSKVDPYSATAAATAALYGPLHGGANEAVVRMLESIGSVAAIPKFLESVRKGEQRLMGFGHRVYKNYDPRARIIKDIAHEVFEVTGRNPLLEIALELEKIALEDDYFMKRKLYPNVDFYSGLIYQSMRFPTSMFPVLFAIPRTAGWLAQWEEMMRDPDLRIARPRQIYTGQEERPYVEAAQR